MRKSDKKQGKETTASVHSTQEEKGALGEAEDAALEGHCQRHEERFEGLAMVLAKDRWIKPPWCKGTL